MRALKDSVLYSICIALFLSVFAFNETISAQSNRLITGNSAGNIRLGMTVAQARAALSGYRFSRTSDGEGVALIEVSRRGRTHMFLYAGEFDPASPINNSGVIEFIEVRDSTYRTSAGVGPEMRVRDAENRYGKLTSIMLSEIEAREFARFASQPAGIDFRVQNRRGMAGIYPSGQTITTRYSGTAYIWSVIVVGGVGDNMADGTGNNNNDDNQGGGNTANYSSNYTDLRTQCRTPGNQGNSGHISTYCQGFNGYRIHIYDTATTMEINVQSDDQQRTVHVASQSLSFNRNNKKVEWRMRDGKAFAVIMRAYKYQLGEDGLITYPERRTGEFLLVKGLPGYEHIDYEVNVRNTSNANEQARRMADQNFVASGSGGNSNAAYQNINVNRFNRLIDLGSQRREAWTRSATQVVVRIIGDMQEVKTRTIRFVSPSAEGGDSMTVVVTDNGLLDDSVRSERLRLELKKNRSGVWRVISGRRSWRCQQGRGHQNFSAAPCT